MPMKTIHCKICGKAISGSTFEERMKKLRRHRKKHHPSAHKKSVKKGVKTKMGKHKSKKKWGKIGAPHSAKRKAHMRKIRKKR